ncbi:MAG: PEP-CTERM sorting domain-containing protein [Fimbriimonadaceae bacterium]|nr:PEP-CTERM sorting domain-containing protein [Fimbriimonadaceae bacterium]
MLDLNGRIARRTLVVAGSSVSGAIRSKAMAVTLVVAVLSGVAPADNVVVANQYATTPWSPAAGLNTFIRDTGQARTGQLLIHSSQLGAMAPGDLITGFSFRMWNGATSTFTGATWADYEIRVGAGVAPSAGSTTFADNFVGAPTLVQDGALTQSGYTSGASGATPNAWGNTITFQTPYVYTGGHLTIEIRHGGSNITNPANSFLEAVATTGTGYSTDYRSFTATGMTATTGAQATFTMTNLQYTPVPEPATMTALGVGALALLRRRRK